MSDHLCPKCKYSMRKGRKLATFTTEVTLVKDQNLVGGNIDVYICPNWGYIESYNQNLP